MNTVISEYAEDKCLNEWLRFWLEQDPFFMRYNYIYWLSGRKARVKSRILERAHWNRHHSFSRTGLREKVDD